MNQKKNVNKVLERTRNKRLQVRQFGCPIHDVL
jgi:hypothetical protein